MTDIALNEPEATRALARQLADLAEPGCAILLSGPVGAGKSELARAFVRAWLSDDTAEVPSPTFTLVQAYEGTRGTVWHCDLYRLGDPQELDELGLEEAISDAVMLIEWPEKLGARVQDDRLDLRLDITPEDTRRAQLTPHGRWGDRLARLIAAARSTRSAS